MQRLNGLHPDQLNDTEFLNGFIEAENAADATIDPNANVGTKDVRTLMANMPKSRQKLMSLNKIFMEIRKKYGLGMAKEWLKQEWIGGFYLHNGNTSSTLPYCFAFDLERLANEGIFFDERGKTKPAKRLTSFHDHIFQFVKWNSNRVSGAVGLPSYFIYSYYFWKKSIEERNENGELKINDPEDYRRQAFQSFVYSLNHPNARDIESAFTNISVMDRCYIQEMFGGRKFPDGTYVIDYVEEIIEHEKVFMEVVAEIRKVIVHTYPVLTYALLYQDGKFVDEEFARWCSDHNCKWYDSNFYVGNDVTSLSSCCFDGDECVLTKSSNGIHLGKISDVVDGSHYEFRRNLTVFHNGSWVKAKPVKLPMKEMLAITTANNKTVNVTTDHLFPTLNGDKKAEDITLDDYILFNTQPLDSFYERDTKKTYEQGFLIGAYAGDGSHMKGPNGTNKSNQIVLSIGETKKWIVPVLNKAAKDLGVDKEWSLHTNNKETCFRASISSKEVFSFIFSYVGGNYSHDKEFLIDSILYESQEFRKGIMDGWAATDGGNSNRIYSVSEKLINTAQVIATSLGINTSITKDETRVGLVAFTEGEKEYKHNYPLWCIRFYSSTNKRSMFGVYVKKNNGIFFKVKEINPFVSNYDSVYCFEMPEQEPYFTLPNGMITHNCRMINDTSKIDGFINSIGGTGLSIGSVQVNTINLYHIALEARDIDDFFRILDERINLCIPVLDTIRHIISRNVEKGLLTNFDDGLIDITHMFNTIGLTAMYEVIEHYGLIHTDAQCNKYYTEQGLDLAVRILDRVNQVKDSYDLPYSINVEMIPAEKANVNLCKKDKLFFGSRHAGHSIYSNQWIPLTQTCSVQEKLKLGALLDKKCGGGRDLAA